jgi:hypothetical protein
MLDETISFVPEDELPKREALPAGTVALIAIRANREGVRELNDGVSEYGPWLSCPFEVIEGEHKGDWAGLMLTIKPDNYKFRAVFTAVTGVDIAGGKDVSFTKFKEQMLGGVFEAELGPGKKKGELTGFTEVTKILRRVRDFDGVSEESAAAPTIEPAAAASDEDIPF